jgi:hypothetical protein
MHGYSKCTVASRRGYKGVQLHSQPSPRRVLSFMQFEVLSFGEGVGTVEGLEPEPGSGKGGKGGEGRGGEGRGGEGRGGEGTAGVCTLYP